MVPSGEQHAICFHEPVPLWERICSAGMHNRVPETSLVKVGA